MKPIVYIALGLFAMAFLLYFVTDKIRETDGGLSRLIGHNEPRVLFANGIKNYYNEDFKSAVDQFSRIVEKNLEYEEWEKAKLMLALSKAAAYKEKSGRDTTYDDVILELEDLIKSMERKNMDLSTISRISEIRSYMDSGFDPALAEWKCCDFRDFGHIYAFGVCGQICRYESCPHNLCSDIPWSLDLN